MLKISYLELSMVLNWTFPHMFVIINITSMQPTFTDNKVAKSIKFDDHVASLKKVLLILFKFYLSKYFQLYLPSCGAFALTSTKNK